MEIVERQMDLRYEHELVADLLCRIAMKYDDEKRKTEDMNKEDNDE